MGVAEQLEAAVPDTDEALIEQRDIIAPIVYAEHGNDDRANAMITHTVVNRMKSGRSEFTDTGNFDAESIINKQNAFSALNGKRHTNAKNDTFENQQEREAYLRTRRVVEETLKGSRSEHNHGQVLYYNPKSANPKWRFDLLEEVPGDGSHRHWRYKKE